MVPHTGKMEKRTAPACPAQGFPFRGTFFWGGTFPDAAGGGTAAPCVAPARVPGLPDQARQHNTPKKNNCSFDQLFCPGLLG